MIRITKRLDALEAQQAPPRRLVVLWNEPGETDADAWARLRPGEPFDADADLICIRWVSPGEDDGGDER